MNKLKKHRKAFTLIELLMVIAIIGILAGILIPAIGAVRKKANIAASKSQLTQYVTAIQMFKGEYNYYPFPDAQVDGGANLNAFEDAHDFIETLSARAPDGTRVATGGNRRQISFHDFASTEYATDPATGDIDATTIADRFGNTDLFIAIDEDRDGMVMVPDPDAPADNKEIRAPVTAYSVEDSNLGEPDYYLYE